MTTSPFKFLDSYTREDIGSFFGRERETGELFRLCFTAPILVVYGGSGTGKTSLVQCGLQSKFNESDWLPVLVRRSGDLLASLGEAVAANTLTPIRSTDLGEQVANLYLDHFKPVYFLFDQFEELFIFGAHAESEAFFTAIRKLLEKERNAHVIFIVREEYLAELTRYERIIPGLIENRYRVERMARSQAINVVEQLCATNGITCGEGFSAAMVDRLNPEGQGVELSYLQVYLDRCWRTRQNEEPFSIALLERIGYVDDLLGAFLDEQVADTPDPQRAENLLKAFVSDQGTKRQLTGGEAHEWVNAIGTAMEFAEVERLLQVFVAKRLLKDRDERGRYELLHDALARQIYQRITRAEQELIEVRQFVQQAFGQYQKRGVKLTANDLAYLRPYRNQLYLKGEMGAFVEGAFGEHERKEKRQKLRRRVLITSLLVGLIASCFFGYKLYEELKTERAMSESNSMAESSMRIVETDPFIAYLWAEKAYNLFPGLPASRAVLRAYNSLYPQVASYSGTVARVSDDRRTFLIIDPERGFTVHDLEGRTLFSKRLTSHQPQGVQFIASGTHVLCVDSAVTILDLSGRTVFTCDTANWLAYNKKGRFLGVSRDSLVLEKNGHMELVPWRTGALIQSGFNVKSSYDVSTVGFLDSSTVYLFGADSLRLVRLGATPQKIAISAYVHPMTFPQAGVVHGKLVCDTRSGTSVFDLVTQRWIDLRLDDGQMTWTHIFDDVVIVQVGSGQYLPAFMKVYGTEGNFDHPKHLSGWFVQHFASDGTTLATPSEQEKGVTILYGRDGRTLLRTVGYPAAFDKLGFVTVSDSSVYSDRVIVWDPQGQPISKLALKRVSAIHIPPDHAIWLEHVGDTALLGYFTDAVFNDRQLKEFRIVQSGLVTCYLTVENDLDYSHRNMFVALAEGRSLVNRGENGHVLTKRQVSLEHIPYGRRGRTIRYAILPMGFVGGDYSTTKGLRDISDTASAYSAWNLSLWRPGSYTRDSIVDEGRRFWSRSIMASRRGLTSPFGDLFRISSYSFNRERALGGDVQVNIWDLRSGQELKTRWLEKAEDVLWSDQDTAVALVVGSDSIHIMDRRLKNGLLSETRDSSMLASESEDRCPVFWNMQKNLLRIVNLASVSIHLMRIDPAQLDVRIDTKLGMYPDRSRISAQNDSTAYFILNYWSGGGIVQRFINGKACGTVETPGSSRLCYRNGVAYLRSKRITVKDGDYGIQQEPGDQVTYYRLDDTQGGLRLTKVPMRTVEPPEMQYNVLDDRIRWWGDELLKVDGNLLDVHLPQRVLATHRLVNEYEEFPMSPKAAIDLVRNKKVYGEFWKKYFSTPE